MQWVRGVILIGSILPMASFASQTTAWQDLVSMESSKPIDNQLIAQGDWPANPLTSGKKTTQNNYLENQVERIDQEIILLRAELAQKNSDINQVRIYINQLNRMVVLPVFQKRLAVLKLYLTMAKRSSQTPSNSSANALNSSLYVSSMEPLRFPDISDKSIIVILLPLTGPYAQAGNKVLSGLKSGLEANSFQGSLAVFDTAIYKTVFELWEIVKYYDPDFIFGPLQKQTAQQWQGLKTGIPTFYFNSMNALVGYERAFSPSKSKGLGQILSILENNQFNNVLALTDSSESAKKLEAEFYQAWSSLNSRGQYQHQTIEKTVGQSIEAAMNINRSEERYRWLQRVTESTFEFTPRPRRDIEAVVSFIPQNKAIQVGPILDFYQLNQITHIWYPNQTPTLDSLRKNLASWQQTYAILPVYTQAELAFIKSNTQQEDINGPFYALGQVAIEIVKNSAISDGQNLHINTEFGAVSSNMTGQFHLLPVIYWVDQGVLERVTEFSETFTK
ncbi:penicillin-binding protein activator [Thiomicrorhabdus arctica]|uniref:penicillin-binding protein activator n=1 Tax=Thiomicrorhabdus arctica TaxID=131540 RepID=UPI0003689D81|nr:penicillin-binding protein activator [Thiomicrorhabdus arctica]